MTDVRTVYVTAADPDQAADMAAALLAKGLIACANVLPPMRSLYLWKGEVQDEPEVAMLLKTRADRLEELIAEATRLHPYEVPCVVVWPIDAGHESYLDWVRDVCRP